MRKALVILIKFYQKYISAALGPRCRFYPTCSEYTKVCLEKYDTVVALSKSTRRIASCHPFHPGGVDLP